MELQPYQRQVMQALNSRKQKARKKPADLSVSPPLKSHLAGIECTGIVIDELSQVKYWGMDIASGEDYSA